MNARVRVLRALIAEGLYVVDGHAVAEAMILRVKLRHSVPENPIRNDLRGSEVRSFRRHDGARSFRLSGSSPRRSAHR